MRKDTRPSGICPSCGSDQLLSVSFEETGVDFRICPECEQKWWERDGATMDLATVLPLVAR